MMKHNLSNERKLAPLVEQSIALPRGRVARFFLPKDLDGTDMDFIDRQMAILREAVEYKCDFDLSHITGVARSEWTGDYFLDQSESVEGRYHICDYNPDRELYDAITALIERWPSELRDEGGTRIYTRPDKLDKK